MLRTRTLVAAPFATLAVGALFLTAQPNSVKQIADGVWFREGDIKTEGHCNNIIIEMKDYLVVIDANFPSGARRVMEDVKKLSKKPIKYVFDTHHHGDHAYANAVWTKAGATTLAHANVVAEMDKYEPQRWQEASKERKDVRELNLKTAERPKQTFSTSPFVLTDGKRKIEFHHFGWAHTRGDGFAFLPAEKILCTGDAVVNGPYNYTADGNVGNWPEVVKSAQKLGAAKVLPGHGPAGGTEILSGELAFMTELRKAVDAARKSGKKLEQVVTMKDKKPTASSLKLPDSVKNWVGDFFPAQVYDTWMELEKGAPRGSLKL
ncbi:MAG: MBL fold metallo-hydrolase [Bryobacterales bacterium]|nr:MBL fold metallo-hydrolase [Bryobacterales bacterium]